MTNEATPLVTIGIPTYNRADGYLKQALQSALNQTYSNIEIIIADNCSTDDTDKLIERYVDSRIRYFKHFQNIGPNNNFNFCVEQAKGDYFLLLHDDDLIDKDFVETCMESIKRIESPGIIRTGTRLIDDSGNIIKEKQNQVVGLTMEDFLLGWFAGKTSLYLCSTIFNTKKLKEIGGFFSKNNLFQDVVAEVILASNYGRIDIANVKASFRKHSGELTFGVNVRDWCEDSLYLLNVLSELSLDNKENILKKGKKFLSRLNYNRASAVTSTVDRFKAYLVVYRIFGFNFDLFYSFLSKGFRNIKRSIKKTMKEAIFGG